jgi:hypothetical protein
MSTSETVEFPVGACPCGQGRIVRSITSQDNPWSGADIFHYIDCRQCAGIWRMEYGRFVDTRTEADYNTATQHERVCREKLHELIEALVNQYFADFGATTVKAEHAEMVRLGITSQNYRQYLKGKNEGFSPAQMCYALKNGEWLMGLALAASQDVDLQRRQAAYETATAATNDASKKIVRLPMPKYRPPGIGPRAGLGE